MAARSDSAPASARCPTSRGDAGPRRKCVPSTMTSIEVTANASPRTTAASSPSHRTTRDSARRDSAPAIASISARSRTAAQGPATAGRGARRSLGGPLVSTRGAYSRAGPLPVAVDDAGPVKVVRGDLDAHPVPRQDPDAEPPHLPGDVAEHLVAVVQLDPEHGVRERLDDLAFEFDLLFLGHRSDGTNVGGLRALARLADLVLDLRALHERAETVTRDAREVDEGVLAPVVRGDEAEALLVAEPLDDTSCHTTPPHCWSDARGGAAGHCLPACFDGRADAAWNEPVYTSEPRAGPDQGGVPWPSDGEAPDGDWYCDGSKPPEEGVLGSAGVCDCGAACVCVCVSVGVSVCVVSVVSCVASAGVTGATGLVVVVSGVVTSGPPIAA